MARMRVMATATRVAGGKEGKGSKGSKGAKDKGYSNEGGGH
jgi:hypothetical protein